MRINHAVSGLGAILIVALLSLNIGNVHFSFQVASFKGQEVAVSENNAGELHLDMSFIYLGFIFSLILFSIAGAIYYRKLLGRHIMEEIFAGLVSFGIFISLLMLFLYLSTNMHPSFGVSRGFTWNGFFNAVIFYILLGLLLAIILFSLLSNIKVKRKAKEKKEEYREYVEEAIYQVKITRDVRGAILAAYREMERMMQARGVRDEKYYTPREFENFALTTLKVSEEPVRELVNLFEHARYSNHPLEEKHRDAALNALEAIKNELS